MPGINPSGAWRERGNNLPLIVIAAGIATTMLFQFGCRRDVAHPPDVAESRSDTDRDLLGSPEPMSERQVAAYGAPRTVDIEIYGRDDRGGFVSHGAGTILHEAGYILTCEHITAPGDRQEVILADGTVYPFTVLGRAGGSYDTAILKIEPDKQLTPTTFGYSRNTFKGEKLMIIGNPDGRRHSVKFGELEDVQCGGGTQIHVGKVELAPGDSGGPVFNMRGEQIALVHVKIVTLEQASRHIRVDHVRDAFAKVFMDEQRLEHTVGIEVDCHSETAQVTSVRADSPAAVAGIRGGDIITRVGTMEIRNGLHYVLALIDHVTVAPVKFLLLRGDQVIEADVHPRPRPWARYIDDSSSPQSLFRTIGIFLIGSR